MLSPDLIISQLEKLTGLQYVLEASAVVVSAFSGMTAARSKQADVVGVYVIACITAFGGGTLRDLLLDHRPLFWVEHQVYPLIILALSLLFVYLPKVFSPLKPVARRSFDWIDALGLGLFSISGTSYALIYRMPYFTAVVLGVMTGTFGGVLRDITLNEVPMVFRQTRLYATCAFAGCWLYLLMLRLGIDEAIAGFLGAAAVMLFRMLAVRFDLKLTVASFDLDEPPKQSRQAGKPSSSSSSTTDRSNNHRD